MVNPAIYGQRRAQDGMTWSKMNLIEQRVRGSYRRYNAAYKRAKGQRTATVKNLHDKWKRELKQVDKLHRYYKM